MKILLFPMLLAFAPAMSAGILQEWRFEKSKSALRDLVIQGDRPRIVNDPHDKANKVMMAELKPGAKRPERSEVMPGVIKHGEERWIGFRVMRPAKDHEGFLSTFQLGPISDPKRRLHGAWQLVSYEQNVWTIRGHRGRGVSEPNGISKQVGAVGFGKWETWVFHVRFRDDEKGLIQIWRDGKSVFERSGVNGAKGDIMRIKWGVYVGTGNSPKKPVSTLFDNVTIANHTSSLGKITGRVEKK